MTYSKTGYIPQEDYPEEQKKIFKIIKSKLEKRHKHELADILFVGTKEISQRRIKDYRKAGKLIINITDCEKFMKHNPEYFL